MNTRIINYKGFTIELGELEGARKAYWRIIGDLIGPTNSHRQHEVECGSWEDLENIAKRSIDAATERQ